MASKDLKPEQIEALTRQIGRQLRYLNRFCARAQRVRWPEDDPVSVAANAARYAMHKLYEAAALAGKKTPNYLDDPETAPGRRRARIQ